MGTTRWTTADLNNDGGAFSARDITVGYSGYTYDPASELSCVRFRWYDAASALRKICAAESAYAEAVAADIREADYRACSFKKR